MTTLFRRLQPAAKFRITAREIAKLLKIPKHLIIRVECWAYVIFVHISTGSITIALTKEDNSLVTDSYNSGKMPLLAKYKTAPLANNYGNCG